MNDIQKNILIDSAITDLRQLKMKLGFFISALRNVERDLETNNLKQPLPDLQKDILMFIDTKIQIIDHIQKTLEGINS